MKHTVMITLSVLLFALYTPPTPTPQNNDTLLSEIADEQIAFSSDKDGNFEIYLMNLDGSNRINLTNHKADDWSPAWSPDGNRIAFSSNREGSRDIYIMDVDGSNLFNLTRHSSNDMDPTWSPTGDQIAFSSDRNGQFDIYVISLDDKNTVQLTSDPERDIVPEWSPDGTQIAFLSYRNRNGDDRGNIFVMDADGSHLFQLTTTGVSRAAKWHPNSTWIFIAADLNPDDNFYSPYILDIETSDSFPAVPYPGFFPTSLSWSPDGSKAVFFDVAEYTGDFYVKDFSSDSPPVKIPNVMIGYGIAPIPIWRPHPRPASYTPTPIATPEYNTLLSEVADEQIVFFSDIYGNFEIYSMNLDGSKRTNLTNHEASDLVPTWSPDGARIAFSSNRDGNREVYIMDADGSNLLNLTQDPSNDSAPEWSPTGNQIAFSSDRSGQYDIYVITLDDMSIARLTDRPTKDIVSEWSPDGTQIAFASYRNENDRGSDIFVMDADGSNLFQLVDAQSYAAKWLPNGSLIAIDSALNSEHFRFYPLNPSWSPDGSMAVIETMMPPEWGSTTFDEGFYIIIFETDDFPVKIPNTFGGHDFAPAWRPHPESEQEAIEP